MKLVAWLLLIAQTPIPSASDPKNPGDRKVIGELTEKPVPEIAPPDAVREYVPDPATQLTIDLAEAQGSMLRELALGADDTMQDDELAAVRRSLERSGLFEIVPIDAAQATLQLRRIGENEVLATLTARAGERVWVKAISWPQATALGARKDDESHYQKLLAYGRERLIIRPVLQSPVGPSTIYYGGYRGTPGFSDPSWGWGNGMIGGTPIPGTTASNWAIIRGTADVMDEIAFAELIGNRAIEERVRDARFKPKLFWALGFGLGAAAGITAGALLYRDDHSEDTRAIGFSLLGLGIGSAIMALLTPTVGNNNKLSVSETEELIADYNRSLRERLELSPAETQKLDAPGL